VAKKLLETQSIPTEQYSVLQMSFFISALLLSVLRSYYRNLGFSLVNPALSDFRSD